MFATLDHFTPRAALLALLLIATSPAGAEEGQYRSKILIDPAGTLQQGAALSIQELEKQLGAMADPYARASSSRHLARHFLADGDYAKAIAYYESSLQAGGLSAVANQEMQRELAHAYLLNRNYTGAVASFKSVLANARAPRGDDFLGLAQAQYLSKDYVGVVDTLDRIGKRGFELDSRQQRQAMALYYRVGAYTQATVLLKKLLARDPDNAEYWHQLASVYLQQNQPRKALDQLALAHSKSVAFNEQQLMLLADLYAANNNPYAAARLLQSQLQQERIAGNATNYRKLFEFWLHAREKGKAMQALAEAARRSNDITLYLYLAQLQMEQEDYQAMERTLRAACARPIDEAYVSRANLLLGINQLKLGATDAARRSFINASLIGGATTEAAQWLQYMDAEPASEKEARAIVSICRGPDDKTARLASGNTHQPTVRPSDDSAVAVKTTDTLRLYGASHRLSPTSIGQQAPALAIRLTIKLIKAGGTAIGPLYLIGNSGSLKPHEAAANSDHGSRAFDPAAPAEYFLALPISGNPRSMDRYKLIAVEPMRCTYTIYEGPAEGIAQAWQELVRDTLAAGYAPTGESRTVFANGGGSTPRGAVRLELQLGIEQAACAPGRCEL